MSKRFYYDEFCEEIFDEEIQTYPSNQSICGILNKQAERIAELEEQLANSIRPKFKIGQEVWIIRGKENRRIDKCTVYGFVNNQCIRLRTSNRGHITRDLIYTFVTKEEAQAKLKN